MADIGDGLQQVQAYSLCTVFHRRAKTMTATCAPITLTTQPAHYHENNSKWSINEREDEARKNIPHIVIELATKLSNYISNVEERIIR